MKRGFVIINCLLVIALSYAGADLFYKAALPDQGTIVLPVNDSAADSGPQQQVPDAPLISRDEPVKVTSRNLFRIELEPPPAAPPTPEKKAPEELEATQLKLVLWGTVSGQENAYAVIEDKKARQQSLFLVGDTVQGARIKEILRQKVILNYQGEDQILEMDAEADKKPGRAPARSPRGNLPETPRRLGGTPPAMPDEKPEGAPDPADPDRENDSDAAMQQIKFRPHYSEGEPDGLMVYGIRPNSVFREMGLRNGDIIRQINGEEVTSREEAEMMLEEVIEAEESKLTLFRRGKIKELIHQAEPEEDSE